MLRGRHRKLAASLCASVAMLAPVAFDRASASGPETIRVSVRSDGGEVRSGNYGSGVSRDGRIVVFESRSKRLVPGDSNGKRDVFVHDVATGETRRVSVASNGRQANDDSYSATISDDGRFVAFESYATNLVRNDTNDWEDVFVHNLDTGRTRRVSVGDGEQEGNRGSSFPTMSAHGRYVLFSSDATNLVRPRKGHPAQQLFVRDRNEHTTEAVSLNSQEEWGNRNSYAGIISASGRYVTFDSAAHNLVRGDTNTLDDIFVRDLQRGRTRRVNVSSDEQQTVTSDSAEDEAHSYVGDISADGRFVVFYTAAPNLVVNDVNVDSDVFVRDRMQGTTSLVSVALTGLSGNGRSHRPTISADGRYVVFSSDSTNLVASDENGEAKDVLIRDLQSGETEICGLGHDDQQSEESATGVTISSNGRFVLFDSWGGDLVPMDTNGLQDVFLRGPLF